MAKNKDYCKKKKRRGKGKKKRREKKRKNKKKIRAEKNRREKRKKEKRREKKRNEKEKKKEIEEKMGKNKTNDEDDNDRRQLCDRRTVQWRNHCDAEREERIVRMGKVTVRQSGCGAGFAAALLSTWVDRCQGVCRNPRAAWSVEDRYQEG